MNVNEESISVGGGRVDRRYQRGHKDDDCDPPEANGNAGQSENCVRAQRPGGEPAQQRMQAATSICDEAECAHCTDQGERLYDLPKSRHHLTR